MEFLIKEAKKLIPPFKIKKLRRIFGDRSFKLLDVGCGNHSPKITKNYFPNCLYYGLDIRRDYNMDEDDFRIMEYFFEKDLTTLDFGDIPDNFFDAIVMSHVIEHLPNGDKVIEGLLKKIASKGYIYIEFPSPRSTRFPKMRGTLNFYDDPTHCRIFTLQELSDLLIQNGFEIIEQGTVRDPLKILIIPLRCLYEKLRFGYVRGPVFWDLLGFAEYILATKRRC